MATKRERPIAVQSQLPGRIPEVASKEYRSFTDEALDGEIVASVDAAHGHYNGLRRELVLRLLPALAEMRRRHAAQGVRNDLNRKLGLPRRAGWEDYLRSRGLKPDTVRNWLQKHTAVKTLGFLVGAIVPRKAESKSSARRSSEPRLYRVSAGGRVLIVAATSAREATTALHRNIVGFTELAAEVAELGQVIEVSTEHIGQQKAQRIRDEFSVPESDVLKALTQISGETPEAIAKRLGISVVDVRRVQTKHRLVLLSRKRK